MFLQHQYKTVHDTIPYTVHALIMQEYKTIHPKSLQDKKKKGTISAFVKLF